MHWTGRDAELLAHAYAHSVGATIKVVGDYAWKSPLYNSATNRGRFVRIVYTRTREHLVVVYDNKCGRIELYDA